MFHFDGGLKLTEIDLAIDIRRRQPRAFVSHAHADHMARHQLAICTPETARLYKLRLGERDTMEMPYGKAFDWGSLRLTALPAGHCLGSAMLLVEGGQQRLLYTGDFKLGPSATATAAELPQADVLIMETTYGDPRYRFRPREEVLDELCQHLQRYLADGTTPVIFAYALGKGQEITRLLTDRGFAVVQHRAVYEVSRVYEQCGVSLGSIELFDGQPLEGKVLIVPPHQGPGLLASRRRRWATFAVSGWAVDPAARRRLRVDHAIPLSDHADYDELWATIDRVQPREVYCTHGPESFVDRLRSRGVKAFLLQSRSCVRAVNS